MSNSHFRKRSERGYVLLAILFALTVLIIGLAAAAPNAAKAIQRTKEDELIRRGQQYALAIRRFYKKFGRYPSTIDQLEDTNNIRFLRRHYLDPITGKDDWAAIQFGQARPATGFFGQKVVNTGGQSPSGIGLGPSSGLGLGASPTSSTQNGSNTTAPGVGGTGGTAPSQFSNANNAAGPGIGNGPNSSPSGPTGSAGNPISGDQLSGRTFGGGAIVGVSVPSQKESLKEFQQKNHYNDWQFVYDPTMDPTLRGGVGTGAATGVPGVTNNPGFGGTNPFQSSPAPPASPNTNPPRSPSGTNSPQSPQ